jgi:hypothetical protein
MFSSWRANHFERDQRKSSLFQTNNRDIVFLEGAAKGCTEKEVFSVQLLSISGQLSERLPTSCSKKASAMKFEDHWR